MWNYNMKYIDAASARNPVYLMLYSFVCDILSFHWEKCHICGIIALNKLTLTQSKRISGSTDPYAAFIFNYPISADLHGLTYLYFAGGGTFCGELWHNCVNDGWIDQVI